MKETLMRQERYRPNPYLELFYGQQVNKSEIVARVPYTLPAIYSLLNGGQLYGQYTLDNDLVLWMKEPRNIERRVERGRERFTPKPLALVF
jgi:hypothetical protein